MGIKPAVDKGNLPIVTDFSKMTEEELIIVYQIFKDGLVEHYLIKKFSNFIYKIINDIKGEGTNKPFETLYYYGQEGLLNIIDKIELDNKGWPGYLYITIKGHILDAVRKDYREETSVPISTIRKLKEKKEMPLLEDEIDSYELYMKTMKVDKTELLHLLKLESLMNAISLDKIIENEESDVNILEAIKDQNAENPEELMIKKEPYEKLYWAISMLTLEDKKIIEEKYLSGNKTLKELGKECDLVESRMSQKHTLVLKELKALIPLYNENKKGDLYSYFLNKDIPSDIARILTNRVGDYYDVFLCMFHDDGDLRSIIKKEKRKAIIKKFHWAIEKLPEIHKEILKILYFSNKKTTIKEFEHKLNRSHDFIYRNHKIAKKSLKALVLLDDKNKDFNLFPYFLKKRIPPTYARDLTYKLGGKYALFSVMFHDDNDLKSIIDKEGIEKITKKLCWAMEQLPEIYKKILEGVYFENRTIAKLGNELGTHQQTIYNYHIAAKKSLKALVLLDKENIKGGLYSYFVDKEIPLWVASDLTKNLVSYNK